MLTIPTVACKGQDAAPVGRRVEAAAEAVEGRLRVQIQGVRWEGPKKVTLMSPQGHQEVTTQQRGLSGDA